MRLEPTKKASEKPFVALFGVKDLDVVTSKDAVLIADRKNTTEMKAPRRQAEGGRTRTADRILVHPLGAIISRSIDGGRYQVKRIVLKKGGRLSLQYHNHRAERWVVVRGKAKVTIGETVTTLHENQSINSPTGTPQRLEIRGRLTLN